MCGISGIISKKRLSGELKTAGGRMSRAQIHRGPDGAGEFFGEQIALASRRLSIIDPQNGWQPLYNEDKSLVLIANGEIYNYVELREQLQKSGHVFRTESDCETILHLYEEDNENFINSLRGMFAFALWDAKRERLTLARDRMGEKPMYLYEDENNLFFASEMKSLLRSGCVPFELDVRAVNLYFYYQYVPEPLTAIKNVRKLDAATMLTIDAQDWKFEEKIYWRMADAPPLDGEPKTLIRERLEETSDIIIRSDTPVGTALSGGLDSSVVAAFAAKKQPDLRAFSVGYKNRPESDERADAEKTARFLKIPFFDVELDTEAIVDFFPELNYWRDDPIADISGFGYFAVMKLARENGVPVMLQGQGGDELFWGYPQLRESFTKTTKKTALLKNPFSQSLIQTLNAGFSSFPPSGFRSNWRKLKQQLKNPERMIFYDNSPDFAQAESQMRNFYSREFNKRIDAADAYSPFHFSGENDSLEVDLTALICKTYLRENGIAQGDRLGMASSVEMRLPLVDHKFVETIIGLRKTRSDAGLPAKYWLREAVKDVLPEWIINRPKRGFAPPTREWHEAIFAAHGKTLDDGYLVQTGILSGEGGRILAGGDFPPSAVSPLSFKALVLEYWCRQMIEKM